VLHSLMDVRVPRLSCRHFAVTSAGWPKSTDTTLRASTSGNVPQSSPIDVLTGFPKPRVAGSIPAEGTTTRASTTSSAGIALIRPPRPKHRWRTCGAGSR